MLALSGWMTSGLLVGSLVARARSLRAMVETVAHCCHELRGPLLAARLGLELEARTGGSASGRQRSIGLELDRAALALQDLDEAIAAGAGGAGLSAPWQDLDVAELLADSVQAWRPLAQARGIELRLIWIGPAARVRGLRARLAQATGNLIGNAIEHGAGPIEVSGSAGRGLVRIEVLDRGPGLAVPVAALVARRDRLAFAALRRPGPPRRRGHGLAVACEVAAMHGGRLAAAPAETGARLVLELPVALALDELGTGRS